MFTQPDRRARSLGRFGSVDKSRSARLRAGESGCNTLTFRNDVSPAFLDELRARTVLSAVIAPTVKLIRAGREWKACCPFHNEKTPSFTVNDDKGFYHCFGCGAHGDAIRFLTDNRGMPFMDAVKELAAKAGLDVPAPDPQSEGALRARRRP